MNKSAGRTEIKYLIFHHDVEKLVFNLQKNMSFDPYSNESGYLVQSLYYDTGDYKFYREKVEGQRLRRKLRSRIYKKKLHDTVHNCILEIKERYGRCVRKFRLETTPDKVRDFIDGKVEKDELTEDFENIHYLCRRHLLVPAVMVSYRRVALVGGVYDPGLRVTIDTGLKFRKSFLDLNVIADENYFISPLKAVLEVKSNGKIPQWLYSILIGEGFAYQKVSKYALALKKGFSGLSIDKKKHI